MANNIHLIGLLELELGNKAKWILTYRDSDGSSKSLFSSSVGYQEAIDVIEKIADDMKKHPDKFRALDGPS